jgi:hypothetical protein
MVIGPLMVMGALPAAGQTGTSPASGYSVQLAANSAADRDSFTQEAHAKTAEWQRKLGALRDKADANGKAAGNAAEDDVTKAWAKVETAMRRLENAGADGWDDAKSAYQTASNDLAAAWRRHHPEDK